jgi:signal peptidase
MLRPAVFKAALVPGIAVSVLVLLPVLLLHLSGRDVLAVTSGSMRPAFDRGAAIVVERLASPDSEVKVGDVIVARGAVGGVATAHRVVAVQHEGAHVAYETQGDANITPDRNHVAASMVEGRVVVALPFLGFVIEFARQPAGLVGLFVLPLLLLASQAMTQAPQPARGGL